MAVRLLDGVTATGASVAFKANTATKHTVQVDWTNTGGSVTAMVVALEGTINNQGDIDAGVETWFTMASHTITAGELTAKAAQFQVDSNGPEKFVRVNITTLTETGTTAVYVRYQGFEEPNK
jgi:hypothetical protein